MEQRIVVYPYKMSSEAGKSISKELNALRVYPDRGYSPRSTDVIFNWGSGTIPNWYKKGLNIINTPESVAVAINKRATFRLLRKAGVSIPFYTTDQELAMQWAERGTWVVCRNRLEGKDGEGLTLAKKWEEIIPSKIYTQFIPNKREFRAYVWMGKCFEIIDKKRKDVSTCDPDIRCSSRGWVHCKNPKDVPQDVAVQAVLATKALGLDFSGVDILYDGKNSHVLEVNTAPGIYGTTVTTLRDMILKYAKSTH